MGKKTTKNELLKFETKDPEVIKTRKAYKLVRFIKRFFTLGAIICIPVGLCMALAPFLGFVIDIVAIVITLTIVLWNGKYQSFMKRGTALVTPGIVILVIGFICLVVSIILAIVKAKLYSKLRKQFEDQNNKTEQGKGSESSGNKLQEGAFSTRKSK